MLMRKWLHRPRARGRQRQQHGDESHGRKLRKARASTLNLSLKSRLQLISKALDGLLLLLDLSPAMPLTADLTLRVLLCGK